MGIATLTNYYETRRCRCKQMCANVPERPEGRVWTGIVTRDENGAIYGHVTANESGWDGATYALQMSALGGCKFEADEWEALEKC